MSWRSRGSTGPYPGLWTPEATGGHGGVCLTTDCCPRVGGGQPPGPKRQERCCFFLDLSGTGSPLWLGLEECQPCPCPLTASPWVIPGGSLAPQGTEFVVG